jgi:Tol biopolymer transport system component
MYADGSGRRLLDPEGWGVEWSPDGHKLAWVTRDQGANITVYDLIEGSLTTIFRENRSPYGSITQGFNWSPDGKRVCFKGSRQDGKVELVVAPVDESDGGLRTWPLEKVGPDVAWSPDGKKIVIYNYSKERKGHQLYWLDPDSDDPPRLLDGQDPNRKNLDPEWSPDGKQIVFSSAQKT